MKLRDWIKSQHIQPAFLTGQRIRIIGIPVRASQSIETICEGIVESVDDDVIYFEGGKLVWNGEWFGNCLKIQFVEDDVLPLTE
jgi:hypothetical protein